MRFHSNPVFVKKNYFLWIKDNYPTPQSAKLKCFEASLKMKDIFPELTVVRGMILVEEPFDLPPFKTTHWWCLDPNNFVVDPTAHQYPTDIIEYTPVDESKGDPTGKCPNCGDLCYDNEYLCSKQCEKDYMAYLNDF